jgi:PAS domain S-box-containing protein
MLRLNNILIFRLLFAASLLVPAAYFGASAWETRQRTLHQTDLQIAITVRLLSEHMNEMLRSDRLALAQVDELVRGLSWDEIRSSARLHQQLQEMKARLPQVDGIALIAPDGQVAAGNAWAVPPPINTADRDYFSTLRDRPDLNVFISRTYPGRVFPEPHFQVSRRRSATGGIFDGVIVLSTRPAYLTDFYNTFIGPDGMVIALFRQDGAVLARYPADVAVPNYPQGDRVVTAARTAASGHATYYSERYQQTRVVAFSRVPDSDLVVAYGLSRAGILASWRADLLRYGVLTAFGSIALASMTWLAMTNTMRISAARRQQEAMNAALRQEVAERTRIEAELRDLNRDLENRVAMRTAGLTELATQRTAESAFLTAVLESTPYAKLVVDQNRQIIMANGASEALFGYRREEMIRHPLELLLPEQKRLGHVALFDQYIHAPAARPMGSGRDLTGRRKDGTEVPVEILLAPVQSADGPAVIAGIVDITQRKQHEAALLQANRELRAANADLSLANATIQHKSEEVEAFVYIVSHDLRTPLITLQGFSRELELSCADLRQEVDALALPDTDLRKLHSIIEQDIDSTVRYIRASTTRFERLINALLDLSRTGQFSLRIERVDLGAIVAETLQSLDSQIAATQAEIVVRPLPNTIGDAFAIGRIVTNLLGNAIKYRHPGRRPDIEVGGSMDGAMVHYWISDNGVGIPASALPRLFQVFQRFHPKLADGDGIGLASVRRLVERHGGTVWAESEAGRGTTFHFTLPAVQQETTS